MRALLLAAGLGTRLRPLTLLTPKCLVQINNKPLLGIWLEHLTKSGIGPFLINTHYLHKDVEKYVNNSQYSNKISLVYEPELLGTAGTLIANLDFFQNNDGLLIHADNYCLADFFDFQKAHFNRPPECVMTMMTFRTSTPSSCGIVKLDERGVVVEFHEKKINPPGNLANGAVYIISSELLKTLSLDFRTVTDFSTQIINRFVGRIYSYETSEILLDIGTPETYEHVNNLKLCS